MKSKITGAAIALTMATAAHAGYTVTRLVDPTGGGLGYFGTGLNNSGVVVGYDVYSPGQNALVWNAAGNSQVLGAGPVGRALNINDAGTIVGYGAEIHSHLTATTWNIAADPRSINQQLDSLSMGTQFAYSLANGVNAAGLVVGMSYDTVANRACTWTGTAIKALPKDAASVDSGASAVNSVGTIVRLFRHDHTAPTVHLVRKRRA